MAYETGKHTLGPWKGVLYNVPVEEVPTDYLGDVDNVEVSKNGAVVSRKGYDEYIATPITATPPCMGLGEHRFTAAVVRKWAIFGAKFYENVSGTWTDRTGGMTITNDEDNQYFGTDAGGVLVISSLTDGQFK